MTAFKKSYEKAMNAIYGIGSDKIKVFERLIGYEWEHFGAIEGDSAKRVDVGDENIYNLLYKVPLETVEVSFPKHSHDQIETAIVLKGRVKVSLGHDSYFVEEGMSYSINARAVHSVTFYGNTILSLQFHPSFENGNWSGQME